MPVPTSKVMPRANVDVNALVLPKRRQPRLSDGKRHPVIVRQGPKKVR